MPQVSPAAHRVAQQVLRRGAGESPDPAALADAVLQADARLGQLLATLIGVLGYTTLLTRAVYLAQADVPALAGITVGPDTEGHLRGVHAFAAAAGSPPEGLRAVETGLTIILAQVVGLLIIFIGEDLALRLVREAWPEINDDHATREADV